MVILIVYYLLELLKWLIIARAISSWVVSPHSRNPAVVFLRKVTDPILEPISAVIPPMGGVDLSAIIAFGMIYLTQALITGALF